MTVCFPADTGIFARAVMGVIFPVSRLSTQTRAHGVEESILDQALDLRKIARGNSG